MTKSASVEPSPPTARPETGRGEPGSQLGPHALAESLVNHLRSLGSVVVAFSGGVDSSVVAAAARRSGQPCLAVTAKSPAVASWQISLADEIAAGIGIEHVVVHTDESERADYRRNAWDRCFYCKQTLYEFLRPIADERTATIVSGTNADDLGDHRPGISAGREAGVATPLADLRISKIAVRELASLWGLPNADLPASPCLASRIAYGIEVTQRRLWQIEQAEDWLRSRGWRDVRVRLHADELARIEVPIDELPSLVALTHTGLHAAFRQFGFRHVTLDLAGLRSGSLNEGVVAIGVNRHQSLDAPEITR